MPFRTLNIEGLGPCGCSGLWESLGAMQPGSLQPGDCIRRELRGFAPPPPRTG